MFCIGNYIPWYLCVVQFLPIMQNEDDLRGLAKVMQFMRAVSILMIVIHLYWYCFPLIHSFG